MSDETQWITLDAAGRVAEDLSCVGCGYNLRTIAAAGDCPECGAAVKRAIWVVKLRWADPRWLRSMSYSVFWLTIGLGVLLASPLLFLWPGTPPLLLMATMIAVSAVTVVVGAWQATVKEDEYKRRWVSAMRVVARMGVVGGIGLLLAIFVTYPLHSMLLRNGWWVIGADALGLLVIGGVVMIAIGTMTGMGFALSVVRRIKHRYLAHYLAAITIGFAMHALYVLFLLVVAMASRWADAIAVAFSSVGLNVSGSDIWRLTRDLVGSIGILNWTLWFMGLLLLPGLWWYRHRLRDAARVAGLG